MPNESGARKLVYYIGASIDGYIAGPTGNSDFFPVSEAMMAWIARAVPETLPTHVRPMLGLENVPPVRFDSVLMGRGAYQPGLDVGITSPYAHLEQHVVSSTLADADPAVRMIRRDPIAAVRELKQSDGMDIWLCGGGTLAGALLPEIDELIVKRYPVIVGSGIAMFDGPFDPTEFEWASSESVAGGVDVTRFVRP